MSAPADLAAIARERREKWEAQRNTRAQKQAAADRRADAARQAQADPLRRRAGCSHATVEASRQAAQERARRWQSDAAERAAQREAEEQASRLAAEAAQQAARERLLCPLLEEGRCAAGGDAPCCRLGKAALAALLEKEGLSFLDPDLATAAKAAQEGKLVADLEGCLATALAASEGAPEGASDADVARWVQRRHAR